MIISDTELDDDLPENVVWERYYLSQCDVVFYNRLREKVEAKSDYLDAGYGMPMFLVSVLYRAATYLNPHDVPVQEVMSEEYPDLLLAIQELAVWYNSRAKKTGIHKTLHIKRKAALVLRNRYLVAAEMEKFGIRVHNSPAKNATLQLGRGGWEVFSEDGIRCLLLTCRRFKVGVLSELLTQHAYKILS